MAEKLQTLPYVTIEVSDASPQNLIDAGLGELAGLEGLEGWKIFKKIGRAFKKVGHAIKKFKFSKIFKVAIPFAAGAILGPLAPVAAGTLAKKFGGKVAALIKKGNLIPQKLLTAKGPAVAFLNSAQGALVKKVLGNVQKTLTDAALAKVLNTTQAGVDSLIAPGVQYGDGNLNMPVLDSGQPAQVTTETIDAKPGFLSEHGGKILMIGGGLLAVPLLMRMMKK